LGAGEGGVCKWALGHLRRWATAKRSGDWAFGLNEQYRDDFILFFSEAYLLNCIKFYV
jgi:hypothetical protein